MHIHFQANPTECLLLIFLAIVFLQSGLDKILDWSGNLTWLKSHFSKSVLKNVVPFVLGIVTIMEVLSGILSLIGLAYLLLFDEHLFAWYAALLSGITLLMLLLGQRLAKDYEGAKTIVIYLMPTVFLLFLLQ
ncbi:MAG: DoxX family protein [Bacteroidota bacterium]